MITCSWKSLASVGASSPFPWPWWLTHGAAILLGTSLSGKNDYLEIQGLDTQLFARGLAFDTTHFANHGILAVAAIPEPSRALLVGLALLGLLMRRHR